MTLVFIPDTEAAERMGMAARLAAIPGVSVRVGDSFSTPADELAAAIGEAEILCVALARVDASVIAAAPRLRLVVKCGIGTESIDLDAARENGIGVVRTAGVNTHGAAEYVIAAALLHGRRLPGLDAEVRGRRWPEARLEWAGRISSLAGKTMGIVGLGAIGMELAKIAAPFGFRIAAIRRRADEPAPPGVESVWPPDRLLDLLAFSDVVVLAAPHTPETKHLIERHLDMHNVAAQQAQLTLQL